MLYSPICNQLSQILLGTIVFVHHVDDGVVLVPSKLIQRMLIAINEYLRVRDIHLGIVFTFFHRLISIVILVNDGGSVSLRYFPRLMIGCRRCESLHVGVGFPLTQW